MTTEKEEIAWAAGLFEGEGCITSGRPGSIGLECTNTDLDVLQRFLAAVKVGKIYGPSRCKGYKDYYKDMYRWRLSKKEHVQYVWDLFAPFLGARRTARFEFFKHNIQTDFRFGPRGPYGPRKLKEINEVVVQ